MNLKKKLKRTKKKTTTQKKECKWKEEVNRMCVIFAISIENYAFKCVCKPDNSTQHKNDTNQNDW